jgi:hypothetical protein
MKQRLLICLIFATAILSVSLGPDFASFRVLAARGPIINTVGGGGIAGFCGAGGGATDGCLNFPVGVAVDGNNISSSPIPATNVSVSSTRRGRLIPSQAMVLSASVAMGGRQRPPGVFLGASLVLRT